MRRLRKYQPPAPKTFCNADLTDRELVKCNTHQANTIMSLRGLFDDILPDLPASVQGRVEKRLKEIYR